MNYGIGDGLTIALLDHTGDDPFGGAMTVCAFVLDVAIEADGAMNDREANSIKCLRAAVELLGDMPPER